MAVLNVGATDEKYIITVPRLMGYKTLIVNAVIMLYGMASIVWPNVVTPDPTSVDVFVTQGMGVLVGLIGLANTLLRLTTSGPAAPFKPTKSDDDKGEIKAVVQGDGKVVKIEPNAPPMMIGGTALKMMRTQDIQRSALALAQHLGAGLASTSWPVREGIAHADDCAMRQGYVCDCPASVAPRVSEPKRRMFSQLKPLTQKEEIMRTMAEVRAKELAAMKSEDARLAELDADVAEYQRENMTVGEALDIDAAHNPVAATWDVGLAGQLDEATAGGADERPHPRGIGMLAAMGQGGKVLQSFFLAMAIPFLLLGAVVSVAGCETVKQIDAITQAETVEQRAFALYGTFVVVEERAAVMIRDKRIPKATRRRVQQLDRIAKPAADTVVSLARQLQAARRTLDPLSGTGNAGRVEALTNSLGNALASFGPKLQALVAAVETAR